MTVPSQALALFSEHQAPDRAVANIALPPYAQREAIFRVLASAANAGAGYNVTIGCEQAKAIARVMLEHERALQELERLRAALEDARVALEAARKTKKRRKK